MVADGRSVHVVDDPPIAIDWKPSTFMKLVATEPVPLTETWLPPDVPYVAVMEMPLTFGSLNSALKYFTALACSTAAVSLAASFASISAVESSAS